MRVDEDMKQVLRELTKMDTMPGRAMVEALVDDHSRITEKVERLEQEEHSYRGELSRTKNSESQMRALLFDTSDISIAAIQDQAFSQFIKRDDVRITDQDVDSAGVRLIKAAVALDNINRTVYDDVKPTEELIEAAGEVIRVVLVILSFHVISMVEVWQAMWKEHTNKTPAGYANWRVRKQRLDEFQRELKNNRPRW